MLLKIRIVTVYTILLGLLKISCYGQNDQQFVIRKIVDSNMVLSFVEKNIKINKDNIFEDSTYIVSKSCSGEWGGTIRFKNKQTGIEYSAASTCPVIVNKLNNKYYITNTLDHLKGSTEVLEITNPELLAVFKLPKPKRIKGRLVRYVGDSESKSTVGTRRLVDSIGILTLASFSYHEKLFHIVTDFEKTFLAKIENNKFVMMDLIADKGIWTYNREVYKTKDNHFIVILDNQKEKRYIDIFENEILIVTSK